MFCSLQSVTARYTCCLAMLCFALAASAQQTSIDSLRHRLQMEASSNLRVDLLNSLANRYYDIKISDSLFYYGEEALKLSEELDYTEGKLAAYTVLSSGSWYISDYEKALTYANQGRELGLSSGITHYLSSNMIAMGLVNSVTGNYEGAFINYFEALSIAEENENLAVQARVLNNIAYLYIATGENEEAIEPLMKAIELNKVLNNPSRMAVYNNNLGVAYKNLKDYENAFKHLGIALEYAKKTNYMPQIGVVLRSHGETHLQKAELDEALRYAQEAITLQRTLDSRVELIRSINLSGDIYLQKKNFNQAIRFAQEALSLSRELGTQLEEARALNTLYSANEGLGNYKQALSWFSQYHSVEDSLFGQEKAREIGRLESRAELERQARENERLMMENELNIAQIGREKARTVTFLIITISLIVLVFGSFYVIRNKQRNNDLIRKQNEALEKTTNELSETNEELNQLSSFKEGLTNMIAHDMKNSLNSIIGYSSKDPEDHRMSVINQSGQNILNLVLNMLDVQRFEEAKVQLNKRKTSLTELMMEARDRVELLATDKRIKLEIQSGKLPSIALDGDLIMRVLVNLLTNAIKYSPMDSTVGLTANITHQDGKAFITASVSDQGEGIEKALLPQIFDKFWQNEEKQSGTTPSTGLGLTFCKLAVESHHGHIYAQSELGKGTTILFDLPLPDDAVLYEQKDPKEATGIKSAITDVEKQVIAQYARELQNLKIYQIKALKEVIDRLEEEVNTNWSKEVMSAAFEGNKERFEGLIQEAIS